MIPHLNHISMFIYDIYLDCSLVSLVNVHHLVVKGLNYLLKDLGIWSLWHYYILWTNLHSEMFQRLHCTVSEAEQFGLIFLKEDASFYCTTVTLWYPFQTLLQDKAVSFVHFGPLRVSGSSCQCIIDIILTMFNSWVDQTPSSLQLLIKNIHLLSTLSHKTITSKSVTIFLMCILYLTVSCSGIK